MKQLIVFAAQAYNPNVFGEFVWMGFDYLRDKQTPRLMKRSDADDVGVGILV